MRFCSSKPISKTGKNEQIMSFIQEWLFINQIIGFRK